MRMLNHMPCMAKKEIEGLWEIMKFAMYTYKIQGKYCYLNDPGKVTPGSLIQGLRNLTKSFFSFLDWTLIELRPIPQYF